MAIVKYQHKTIKDQSHEVDSESVAAELLAQHPDYEVVAAPKGGKKGE